MESNEGDPFEVGREFRGELQFIDLRAPFIESNRVTYIGSYEEFIVQFGNLAKEIKRSIRQMRIEIHGDITHRLRKVCEGATMISGALCLFPMLLLMCHCYKRFLFQQRKLELDVYEGIASCLRECKNLQRLTINLADSFLTIEKCSVLQNAFLSLARLNRFNFQNLMGEYDSQDREYTDFSKTFPKVKQASRLIYKLSWGSKVIVAPDAINNSMNNTAITIAELMISDGNNVLSEKPPSATEVLRELPLRSKVNSSRSIFQTP